MTRERIVQRLVDNKSITAEEAVILLREDRETVMLPYHIENGQDSYWYFTVS